MRAFRLALAACLLLLLAIAPARGAVTPLDGQVNNDNAAGIGIDPTKDAGVSDVVGGALTAGALEIPWATFEQKTTGAQNIFVRAFKGGNWVTEGFPASLNVDSTQEAEGPSIDFAGTGRTVPWVSWYEPNNNISSGGPTQVFASRFAASTGTGGGQWTLEGQDRAPVNKIPSLNINLDRTAENPSVAGGATTPGADPVPWVTWEENDGTNTDDDLHRQIFISKGVKQSSSGATCTGFKPSANATTSNFCWQQVGADRLARTTPTSSSSGDPSLNIDPTRAGVEPDVAFTGANDAVPWVVWYEQGDSGISGFRSPGNDQVFAAKAIGDAAADGKFHWQAVGAGTAGQVNPLDTSATHGFGPCAATQAADDACSLNKVATNGAENPRVASGSLAAGAPTVPWVVWEEDNGSGVHQIFLAHLVGGDHFELFNSGAPLSNTLNNSTRPDIAFSNHEPYVSWHETVGGVEKLFLAHFEGGATAPTFHLDTPDGIASSDFGNVQDLRAPLSSTCTATPFSSDGTTCRAGALGTPFVLFNDGPVGSQHLFGSAYSPSDVQTGDATAVTQSSATIAGSANPGGAPVNTSFVLPGVGAGTTAGPLLNLGTLAQPFTAALTGLLANTTFTYRATASSDFTTVAGADRTFKTAPLIVPPLNDRPISKIVGLPRSVKAKKLHSIHGTASDRVGGVAKVEVAVTRVTRGTHAARAKAKPRCVRMRASGRFRKSKPAKRKRCVPAFIRAKGTTTWKLTLKKRLPKGRYFVYSRATDKAGLVEKGFTRSNRRSLKVK